MDGEWPVDLRKQVPKGLLECDLAFDAGDIAVGFLTIRCDNVSHSPDLAHHIKFFCHKAATDGMGPVLLMRF